MKKSIVRNRYLNTFVMAVAFMALSMLVNPHPAYGLDNLPLVLDEKLDDGLRLSLHANLEDELHLDASNLLSDDGILKVNKFEKRLVLDLGDRQITNSHLKLDIGADVVNLKLDISLDKNLDFNPIAKLDEIHVDSSDLLIGNLDINLEKELHDGLRLNSDSLPIDTAHLGLSDLQQDSLELRRLDV